MKHYRFYHRESGLFHGSTFGTDDPRPSVIAANTPADHVAIEGAFDPLSQRVNVASGSIEDYMPPQPSGEHEWNAQTKRWQLNDAALKRDAARAAAFAQISVLEGKQLRAIREALLGEPKAIERLRDLDAQIATARGAL